MTTSTMREMQLLRRVLITAGAALIVIAWLGAAGIGGPYFGKIDEVSSNDPTAYLPSSAEATEVQSQLGAFLGDDAVPGVVVAVGDTPLTQDQLDGLSALRDLLAGQEGLIGEPSPALTSEDGRAVQIFASISTERSVGEVVAELRATIAEHPIDGVSVYVTGPAGQSGDLIAAFSGIDGLLLGVALAAVFVILLLVYRSPLLPILVLATSLFALCAALLTVWWLAKAGVFLLNGQIQGILFILVIGAATDYALLYVARYREALAADPDRGRATIAAWRGSWEPILASGGTVMVALLCLLFSQLESNRGLGPVGAIGIAFAMLAALTLLPALLFLCGRAAYWPRRLTATADGLPERGVWARLPRFVARRARPVWIVTVVLLAVAALGMLRLDADGVASSELVLGEPEASTGQELLADHFPGGSGAPVLVLAEESALQDTADVLLATDGIASVAVVAADSPSGTAPVTADGIGAVGRPGAPAPDPTVVDGRVLLQGTLDVAADSSEAEALVAGLRASLAGEALVGGTTAIALDTNAAGIHDRTLIIPIVLAVILVILGLLLRAIVAPIVLIATVVLSFAATMGVSALVFEGVLGLPGADPAVPLYGFVFLVALGVDYNIFLMSRVREEALGHGAREGMRRGLAITGGIITSAGLVLAATFAALAVLPILFLLQLAFIVAFGVLLDTLVVRSLLVPALGQELGRAMWWPSRRIR